MEKVTLNLPILYKKTSTGAIQEWSIGVVEDPDTSTDFEIVTIHGQVGTDKPQVTSDVIREGKNIGKKNETTIEQQAHAEAKARHEKQLKKGYVTSIKAAEAGEVDDLIEGGIVPMLAQSFAKHGHKIKYPCHGQPKLDGIRCIAILKDGQCTLWSRTRKLITGVPHIAREIEKLFHDQDLILDGELYNHSFKHEFEKIVSFVRQEEPADGSEVVQYHIYDLVNNQSFEARHNLLFNLFTKRVYKDDELNDTLRFVKTTTIFDEESVEGFFSHNVGKGYEGAMLRNATGLYANKRSYDLQKVKEFDDSEFDIIGVEEGRGKLAGHAIFVCKTEKGTQFLAKMKGDTARLKEYFDDHSLWKGKKLTVQYQGLTGKENVPRFPVGVAIRDYE